ncbi:hypothetical protein MRY87_08635 [bacterium]|nr:hypothetical protein [bacterium]
MSTLCNQVLVVSPVFGRLTVMPYQSNIEKAFQEFDQSQPAILLVASDRVRLEYLDRRVVEEIGGEGQASSLFFGDSMTVKEVDSIITELFSPALFASQEIIRILRADEMKSAVLDAFLKAPLEGPASQRIILHATQLKANSRLRKHFHKRKALLELKPIPKKGYPAWTMSHAAALGVKIPGTVAQQLVEIGEESADRIHQCIEHLKLYCEEGASPTTKDIAALFHHHPDPNEFFLLEQILTRPSHEAERAIHELLSNGKNAFLLLNLLGRSTARLLRIASLLEQKRSRAEVIEAIGGSSWIFDKDMKLLKKTGVSKLLRLHQAIISADSRLKGRSLGDENIFSHLVHAV